MSHLVLQLDGAGGYNIAGMVREAIGIARKLEVQVAFDWFRTPVHIFPEDTEEIALNRISSDIINKRRVMELGLHEAKSRTDPSPSPSGSPPWSSN